jgi:TRAP-type C4-dicarboxylate transport system substrate-binding protein
MWLVVVLLASVLVLGACAPQAPQAPAAPKPATEAAPASKPAAEAPAASQPVVLKALMSWTRNALWNDQFLAWVDTVNRRASGSVRIDIVGGPEAVTIFEQFGAVRGGSADMLHSVAGFHSDVVPEGLSFHFVRAAPAEIRATGAVDIVDQIYQARAGMKFLGATECCARNRFFLGKPITQLSDLKGMRIRSVPVWNGLMEHLGVAVVTMPTEEVYSALERGVIDGYVNPGYGQVELGLHEVAKYFVEPGFQQTYATTLIRLDRWQQLPANVQALLNETMLESEKTAVEYYRKKAVDEEQVWTQRGMRKIDLPRAEAESLPSVASDTGFAFMLQRVPERENAQKVQQLLSKLPR